ncbi:hypothetical protein [Marinobacter caseinilyticus]|uniref:hypothetical protein n=1 Tax=Marinobacter caseinilyticus TaxID=2692195 RepID=UPI00140AF687|nr:hypothetical protein [Marinobacter caseinilyticus]
MPDLVDLMPYETPTGKKAAAAKLAEIMGIPEATVPRDADYNQVVAAMAGLFFTGTLRTISAVKL